MEQVAAGNEQAGASVRKEHLERQTELHLPELVQRHELSAQQQAEIEERERTNAALILEEEINRRVLDALKARRFEFDSLVLDAIDRNRYSATIVNLKHKSIY